MWPSACDIHMNLWSGTLAAVVSEEQYCSTSISSCLSNDNRSAKTHPLSEVVLHVQVHSSDKPRLWNMTKDVIIACSLCGEYLNSVFSFFLSFLHTLFLPTHCPGFCNGSCQHVIRTCNLERLSCACIDVLYSLRASQFQKIHVDSVQ